MLKNFSVTVDVGTTTQHVVGVNARDRDHEEAQKVALDVINKTYEQVVSMVVTPLEAV